MSKRVLLDENLPQKLRLLLAGHIAVTTAYQGWAGKSNGELVTAAEETGFDVIVTADQGLNYQQNMMGRKIALVVLSSNRSNLVMAGAVKIATAIGLSQPGSFTFVEIGS